MKTKHLDFPLKIKQISEEGEFSGYGSVFDEIDAYNERIEQGAFRESLSEWSEKESMPKMLWQHRADQPIGVWSVMEEDETGLYVEGRLAMDVRQGQEAYSLLKMKAIDGLSIGYIPIEWTDNMEENVRTLTKIDLWETSIVTFPANESAQIEAVRAAVEGGCVPSKRETEMILRDAGFTSAQAKAFIANGHKGLLAPREAEGGDLDELHQSIQRLRESMKAA